MQYAVVLDAGSSGTRLYLYGWEAWVAGEDLPEINEIYQRATQFPVRGISGCERTAAAVAAYLNPLFDPAAVVAAAPVAVAAAAADPANEALAAAAAAATAAVPAATAAVAILGNAVTRATIPLFLLGTAGLRDFRDRSEADAARCAELMQLINTDINGRGYRAGAVARIITGIDEAIYGWIAANYAYEGLANVLTDGYIEMGGASTQIVLEPAAENRDDYLDNMFQVSVFGEEREVYAKSFPFGAGKAWAKHEAILRELRPDDNPILDECRPHGCPPQCDVLPPITGVGRKFRPHIEAANVILRTFADPPTPVPEVYPPAPEHRREPGEGRELNAWILDGGPILDVPVINFGDRMFTGGGQFWYTTRQAFGRNVVDALPDDPFSHYEFSGALISMVKQDWAHPPVGIQPEHWVRACFVAAFILCVMYNGFRFPGPVAAAANNHNFFRSYTGNSSNLTWTLGKIVLMAGGGPDPVPVPQAD